MAVCRTDSRTNLDAVAGWAVHFREVVAVEIPAGGAKEVPVHQGQDDVDDGGKTGHHLHPQAGLQLASRGRR